MYPEEFLKLSLILPPYEEQLQIIQRLAQETEQTVKAIDHTQREISLLREYRTRLIADVVTGKLDVREVAATLPDELAYAETGPDDAESPEDSEVEPDEEDTNA